MGLQRRQGDSDAAREPADAVNRGRAADHDIVETSIPFRLDALYWSGFHTRVVLALGITWILDGLEVTLAGALSGALKQSPVLHFSNFEVGFANSCYLAGAVLGALGFGWLTDRIGRRKLFFITLALYLTATAATALSWSVASYALFRFLTGAGIGGEYTAINSTIQELLPARYRGWTDLLINGSFWLGAALGATSAIVLLDPNRIDVDLGWRLAYLTGACLGLVVFVMRLWIPESPRWLIIHGHPDQANAIMRDIERSVEGHVQDRPAAASGEETLPRAWPKLKLRMRDHTPLSEVAHTLFKVYRERSLVGLVLMTAQAFFYNAIFFTFALVLSDFYGIPADQIGWYILPFAAGNLLGPLVLGRLFDTLGRRPMIAFTYGASGILLALSGYLFEIGALSAKTQTIAWMVIFFCASPAASAAYLTVSENFPLEVRALAIALFYAIGTGVGGVAGPILFGALIDTGSRGSVFAGYLFGAALMLVAAAVGWRYAVAAERRTLESVAQPLAAWSELMNEGLANRVLPPREEASPAEGALLASIAEKLSKCLDGCAILLDIDGTLLDLARTPREVWVPPGLAATLHALHECTGGALALVSGRSLNDIDLIFAPERFPAIGGHGAEMRLSIGSESVATHAPPMDQELKRRLAAIARLSPGILLEDKGYSLALHYRLAPHAEKAIYEAVSLIRADLPNAPIEILPGKCVCEIKQTGFDKATGVHELMTHEPFRGRYPIFIGDDVTDESVFAAMPSLGGLAFSVGRHAEGVAGHFDEPTNVRAWLARLIDGKALAVP